MLRFLIGILLVQAATAIQLVLALRSEQPEIWVLLGVSALSAGLLVALWFSGLATQAAREAVSKAKASLSQERERVVAQSRQQLARERRRLQTRATLKVGASIAAVAGLGALFLLTQFVGLGLLTLAAGGGAVAGYLFRARQEQRRQPREQALEPSEGSENRERLGEEARQGSDPVPRDGADTR
jgi:hypothetical protein